MSSPSCWQRVRRLAIEQAYEFCLATGLHGYKYIVLPGMHFVERFFWIVGVTAATVAAMYMMAEAIRFNHSHPTITAVDTTYWPIWEVDAPAVTICPANQVDRRLAQTLAKRLSSVKNITLSKEEIFNDMPLLVELLKPRRPTAERRHRLNRLQNVLNSANISAATAMRLVSNSCSDYLVRCRWKRKDCRTCNDIFRRVSTPHGYCCSFNYMDLSRRQYTPPLGGCMGLNEVETTQRLAGCGYTNGLSVVAHIDRKQYMASLLASYTIRVFVHNPVMYPDTNAEDNLVSPSTVTFFGFSPVVVSGSDRLLNLSVTKRRCVFPNEAHLSRFPNYTYNNCMASCRANFSYHLCGCVPFYFPATRRSRICDLNDVECLSTFDHSWAVRNASEEEEYKINGSIVCKLCWPLCSNVQYHVETTYSRFLDSPALNQEAPLLAGLTNIEDLAIFHVFVNDLVATKYKTDVYFTWTSLLGALGGLSGLFVGFSLVSGLELIYFFTIRLFFRFRSESKDLRKVKDGKGKDIVRSEIIQEGEPNEGREGAAVIRRVGVSSDIGLDDHY